MAHIRGFSTTFVESPLPPSPTSRITGSAFTALKYMKAIAVTTSNSVGDSFPSATISSAAASTASVYFSRSSSEMSSPPERILSLNLSRKGDEYRPVRYPQASSPCSRSLHTEPFPLVPATWMTLRSLCGSPSFASSVSIRSSPRTIPNLSKPCILSTALVILPSFPRQPACRIPWPASPRILLSLPFPR